MIKIFNLALVILCITFIACNTGKEGNEVEQTDAIEVDIQNLILQKHDISTDFNVEIINIRTPVEMGLSLSSINKILKVKDGFVCLDKKQHAIFLIDSNYIVKRKIGELGEGPGEYIKIRDLTYNRDTDELLVLCTDQMKVIYFNLEGKFLKENRITQIGQYIEWTPNGIYLYSDYPNNEDEINYLYVLDNNCKVKKSMKPYFKIPPYTMATAGGINTSGSEILFNPPLNDTIEVINQRNKVIRKWIINFGNSKLPESVKNDDVGFLSKGFTYAYLENKIFNINNSLLAFNFVYKSRISNAVYDTKYNRLYSNHNRADSSLNLWSLIKYPVLANEQDAKLYYSVNSESIPDWLENNRDSAIFNNKFYTTLNEIYLNSLDKTNILISLSKK